MQRRGVSSISASIRTEGPLSRLWRTCVNFKRDKKGFLISSYVYTHTYTTVGICLTTEKEMRKAKRIMEWMGAGSVFSISLGAARFKCSNLRHVLYEDWSFFFVPLCVCVIAVVFSFFYFFYLSHLWSRKWKDLPLKGKNSFDLNGTWKGEHAPATKQPRTRIMHASIECNGTTHVCVRACNSRHCVIVYVTEW